jgi:endonuclease V-like protein UPF0215 family
MKPGTRALGVAESAGDGTRSTLAGAVVRADRAAEAFEFGTCTVAGTDATRAVADLWTRLDRPDVRWLFLAGVAPAWFNLVDPRALHEHTDRPVLAVTFEERAEPLSAALEREFDGEALADRRERYERLPERERVAVEGGPSFVRRVGCSASEAREALYAFAHEGGRPEPLRVAKAAARAADAFTRPEA